MFGNVEKERCWKQFVKFYCIGRTVTVDMCTKVELVSMGTVALKLELVTVTVTVTVTKVRLRETTSSQKSNGRTQSNETFDQIIFVLSFGNRPLPVVT